MIKVFLQCISEDGDDNPVLIPIQAVSIKDWCYHRRIGTLYADEFNVTFIPRGLRANKKPMSEEIAQKYCAELAYANLPDNGNLEGDVSKEFVQAVNKIRLKYEGDNFP